MNVHSSKKILAGVICCGLFAVPIAAGVFTAMDPLVAEAEAEWLKLAAIEDAPTEVGARRFVVESRLRDAWNVSPPRPVGAVFLTRTEQDQLIALSAYAPRLGCCLDYSIERRRFLDQCYIAEFDLNGREVGPRIYGEDLVRFELQRHDGHYWIRWPRESKSI